jgi:OOP family OmpA-OmpF porin
MNALYPVNGKAVIPVCLSLLVSFAAHAAEGNGIYFGIGPGLSSVDPDTNNTGYSVDDSRSRGGKVYLGYDFSERLSIEGYYSDLGEAKMLPNGEIGYQDMGLSGVYYFYKPHRVREGFSAFIRGGVGTMKNDTDLNYERLNDSHFMLGGGMEYGLGKGFALRADVDLYDEDAQLFTISLLKRFGGSKSVATQRQPEPTAVAKAPEPAPQPVVVSDSDQDGVPDVSDKCPDTKAGSKVDVTGCKLQEVLVLEGVTFAINSAELIGESHAILDGVAENLKRNPAQRIEVAGYTDSQGNGGYNKDLSTRRARAVREYLARQGVALGNLEAKGYGEENPIADNATAAGRAQNRRVELHMID